MLDISKREKEQGKGQKAEGRRILIEKGFKTLPQPFSLYRNRSLCFKEINLKINPSAFQKVSLNKKILLSKVIP